MLDQLVWQNDRMLLRDLTFRLDAARDDQWDLGEDCFRFRKSKALVDLYAQWGQTRPSFHPRNIFELGIFDGGSVVFWNEYFKPEKHVAIDYQAREDSAYFERYVQAQGLAKKIKTFWNTDQADVKRLRTIAQEEFTGPLDLVIDDASHLYDPSKVSFETLFPMLRPGGFYIVEDWSWCHKQAYQVPNHPWAKRTALTNLVLELVQAGGTSPRLISGLFINNGFAIVERGPENIESPADFKLEQYISMRRQDCTVSQGKLDKMQAKVDCYEIQLQETQAKLAWREAQLGQLQSTRWWKLGTLYWNTYARFKAMLDHSA